MRKPSKLLTNQHLLKRYKNNFTLAEEAIDLAYRLLEKGIEFDLQKVLAEAAKVPEQEEIS